jgi:hypothetical protein
MTNLRFISLMWVLLPVHAWAQQPDPPDGSLPPKHVLWIIPNFRTSDLHEPSAALSPMEKFTIAKQDSLDRGTIALAAVFAAESQATDSNHSFGQGVAGYAHYWATAYADYAVGNTLSEGVFPTLLHQDPRYFRRGSGSGWSRVRYAVGQTFLTHGDSGRRQFNYSEIAGNSAAVAISMAYYPDNRRASDAVAKLGMQIAVDAASNLIKEFWPDRHHRNE